MLELPLPKQKIRGAYAARVVDEVNRNRIIAGKGITLRRTPSGTVITCTAVGGAAAVEASLKPWTVRWHKPPPEDEEAAEPDGQWEVYLPPGTISIGSTCYVINKLANTLTGHEDDDPNWRKIPLTEPSSGERTVRFVAHGKGNVQMDSSGNWTEPAPFVGVFAELEATSGTHNPLDDDYWKTHYPGDTWSSVIATATIKTETVDNERVTTRSVRQHVRAAVTLPGEALTAFRPVWRFDYDPSTPRTPLTLDSIGFETRTLAIGTVMPSEAADEDVSVSPDGDQHVFLHIDTSGSTPTIEIVGMGTQRPTSSAENAYVEFMEFKDNRLTADMRANLVGMPYYRGLD